MNKHNQKGFSIVAGLLSILIIVIVGGIGWYVLHSSQKATKAPNPQEVTTSSYDASKTKNIENFDTAPDSLKAALVSVYYDNAKKNCDQANASVSAGAQIKWVMIVQKVVRDDFAKIQFCGSGSSSIMAYVNGKWEDIGSLAMAPSCSLVDQYKISREITPTCYVDNRGNERIVTYP